MFDYSPLVVFTVGWGANQVHGFGDQPSVKSQALNLIRSIRTVMRSKTFVTRDATS
jgi:Yos1-like